MKAKESGRNALTRSHERVTKLGAQMIMLQNSHPDIIEFIISKMQNPRILRFILETAEEPKIQELAKEKLKFTPLTKIEVEMYESILKHKKHHSKAVVKEAEEKLQEGGTYSVNNPEFLSGANISVCLTDDFMKAVEEDSDYDLRFPAIDEYTDEEKAIYNEKWHEVGDVREWERMGFRVRTYQTIKAKELWNLINICSTYSAEPGIFYLDNANNKTNAVAYGQRVVATNPCGS